MKEKKKMEYSHRLVMRKCEVEQCTSIICLGLPYCPEHTRERFGVRYDTSTIPRAGNGLFATRSFEQGDKICVYYGETISEEELERRYPGDTLGAYVVSHSPWTDRLEARREILARATEEFRVAVRRIDGDERVETGDDDRDGSLTAVVKRNCTLQKVSQALDISVRNLRKWNWEVQGKDFGSNRKLRANTVVWLEHPDYAPNVHEDAARVRGIGSLANTHVHRCNCEMQYVDGTFWLIATAKIAAGEEIFNEYGPEYKLDPEALGPT